jgi:hypothetical protein
LLHFISFHFHTLISIKNQWRQLYRSQSS